MDETDGTNYASPEEPVFDSPARAVPESAFVDSAPDPADAGAEIAYGDRIAALRQLVMNEQCAPVLLPPRFQVAFAVLADFYRFRDGPAVDTALHYRAVVERAQQADEAPDDADTGLTPLDAVWLAKCMSAHGRDALREYERYVTVRARKVSRHAQLYANLLDYVRRDPQASPSGSSQNGGVILQDDNLLTYFQWAMREVPSLTEAMLQDQSQGHKVPAIHASGVMTEDEAVLAQECWAARQTALTNLQLTQFPKLGNLRSLEFADDGGRPRCIVEIPSLNAPVVVAVAGNQALPVEVDGKQEMLEPPDEDEFGPVPGSAEYQVPFVAIAAELIQGQVVLRGAPMGLPSGL